MWRGRGGCVVGWVVGDAGVTSTADLVGQEPRSSPPHEVSGCARPGCGRQPPAPLRRWSRSAWPNRFGCAMAAIRSARADVDALNARRAAEPARCVPSGKRPCWLPPESSSSVSSGPGLDAEPRDRVGRDRRSRAAAGRGNQRRRCGRAIVTAVRRRPGGSKTIASVSATMKTPPTMCRPARSHGFPSHETTSASVPNRKARAAPALPDPGVPVCDDPPERRSRSRAPLETNRADGGDDRLSTSCRHVRRLMSGRSWRDAAEIIGLAARRCAAAHDDARRRCAVAKPVRIRDCHAAGAAAG